MSVINWKDSQLQVINETEGEILVSASAGSGKTAVMIERLIRLIESGTSVDNVLCLTFTEAAAQEIKERLRISLIDRIDNSLGKDKERFERELDRIPFADISTIDGFCRRIVKRYFEKAKEDPTVGVASSDECKNMMYRSAERVLTVYGERSDPVYEELVDFLGKRRTETSVLELIIRIAEFLSTLAGRDAFIESVKEETRKNGYESITVLLEIEKAEKKLRDIKSLALNALKWDLPYPEEVLGYVSKVNDALDKGVKEFFDQAKKNIPVSPNYARLPYKRKKDSSQDIIPIKEKMEEFLNIFAKAISSTIEEDMRDISRYGDKIFELVDALKIEYERALTSANLIDFSGMENKALVCLENDEIRADTVQRYSHVLIDEYQDTNRLQDRILTLCAGGKSFFMVGDAKQSIYEFRHAEPAIFIDKKEKEGIKNHSLQENFRSDSGVIEAVNKVFLAVYNTPSAGEEYAGQEMKTEKVGAPSEFPAVSCKVFFSQRKNGRNTESEIYSVMDQVGEEVTEEPKEESLYVCKKIKQLLMHGKIKDKSGNVRKIEFGDIAILSRSRSDTVKEITELLKKSGIPVSIKEKQNLPYSAEILIHLLKIIDNPLREDSLVCVMLSPIFDFTENELARYKLEGKKGNGLYKTLLSLKGNYEKLDSFLEKLDDYKFRSEYKSVADLLAYVIKDTGFWVKIAEAEDGFSETAELGAYLDSLEKSSIAENLTEYLNYFDKFPYFETERKTGADNAVKIMTIHGSKGLEFPVVFLIDMGTAFNKQDLKQSVLLHKKYGIAIPTFDINKRVWRENFYTEAVKRNMEGDIIAQELRLLYVGMTRARNMLLMSGTVRSFSEQGLKISNDETDASSLLDFIIIAKNKDSSLSKSISFDYGSEENVCDITYAREGIESVDLSKDLIADCNELLKYNYIHEKATVTPAKFTVTGLAAEASDERESDSVALTSSASAEEGTLYHTVMENIDFSLEREEDIEKALDKMLLDDIITQEERTELDVPLLMSVLNTDVIKDAAKKKCMREAGFLLRERHSSLVEGGIEDEVLLQGVIDLLVLGEEPIVVDYKYSGASEQTLRERYGEQIRLYRLAAQDILGVNNVKCYILSLKTAKLIEF